MSVIRKPYSHRRHTGQKLPHHATNFGSLILMLLVGGLLMVGMGYSADAADSGAFGINAVVGRAAPSSPSVIVSPSNGHTYQNNAISVTGQCPLGTLVLIYSNNILIGSIFCESNGTFTIDASLFTGSNALVARAIDILGQSAPDSLTINVTNLSVGLPGLQSAVPEFSDLILEGDQRYVGYNVGDEITVPIRISGGKAPYAININWGDGSSEVISRTEPDVINFKHRYRKPGEGARHDFTILVTASDNSKQTRKLQLTTIVSDDQGIAGAIKTPTGRLNIAWPIWVLTFVLCSVFWLGEIIEKRKLRLQNPGLRL